MGEFFSKIPAIYVLTAITILYNLFLSVFALKTKSCCLSFIFSIGIVTYCSLLSDYFENYPFLCLFLLMFSYATICVSLKHIIKNNQYTIILLIFSIFFIYLITVSFGKYYYKNVEDIQLLYIEATNAIHQKEYNSYVTNIYLSKIYFDIGLEKYFVTPENFKINDIHFIQYLMRYVLAGTIIAVFYDLVKNMIKPQSKKNPANDI